MPLTSWCGRAAALAAFGLLCLCPLASADMEFSGDPVPLSQVAGKPGSFRVTLGERSPLSAPKEIIKRMHLKGIEPEDYEWDKEVYDLYVPKEAGEGGKYGLMAGAVFKDYGAPPGEWGELLDKHHVIWICSETVGEGSPELKRVGTMLDAVHNVRKAYPIQDWRTYASIGSSQGPVAGAAMHYADVFDGGAFYTVGWKWYGKMRAPNGGMWEPDDMTQPDPERLALAKRHGRYFFAKRKGDVHEEGDKPIEIVKKAYPAVGITAVKMIVVPDEQIGHYGLYDPSLFEQAITFLDAGLAKQPPKVAGNTTAAAGAASGTGERAASSATAAAAAAALTADEAAEKADKELTMANNYLALKKYDLARPKLKKIVESYPGTKAAKEAAQLLKEIEGK